MWVCPRTTRSTSGDAMSCSSAHCAKNWERAWFFPVGPSGCVPVFETSPGHPRPQVRVKPSEKEAGQGSTEDKAEHPVAQISRTQAVAMSQKGRTTLEIQNRGFLKELQPDFTPQVLAPPPVVVSTHHRHRDPRVHKGGQGSQHPGMPPGDHTLVLEPEVEQVSIDDNS